MWKTPILLYTLQRTNVVSPHALISLGEGWFCELKLSTSVIIGDFDSKCSTTRLGA